MNILERKWQEFPKRFWNNFVGITAVFTGFSFLVAIAGWKLESDLTQIVAWVVFALVLFLNFYVSIPDKRLTLKKQIGKKLTLKEISEIYPKPYLLGIVGETKTGKSTFMHKSLHSTKQVSRTNQIYGEVIPIPENPDHYFIVIDGDGDKIYQQIEIMDSVDCLLLFVDHSESHQRKQISSDRLKSHESFIKDLSDCLLGRSKQYKIHVVLNKQDLWGNSSKKEELLEWFTKNTENLESRLNCALTTSKHSNLQTDSVSALLNQISSEVRQNYVRNK